MLPAYRQKELAKSFASVCMVFFSSLDAALSKGGRWTLGLRRSRRLVYASHKKYQCRFFAGFTEGCGLVLGAMDAGVISLTRLDDTELASP